MDKDTQRRLAKAFLKNKIKSFLGIIAIAIVVIFITMFIDTKFAARLVVTAISFLTIFLIASIVEFIIGLIKGFKDSNENPIKTDSASNHKYAKYIDENGEIPIFVMEKKYLITDWARKIIVFIVGPLVAIALLGKGHSWLGLIIFIGFMCFFIESFMHDIFIRRVICYDDYMKITGNFIEYKRKYSWIPYFHYYGTRAWGKILQFRYQKYNFTYLLQSFNNRQFCNEDIVHLVKILRQKGVIEHTISKMMIK